MIHGKIVETMPSTQIVSTEEMRSQLRVVGLQDDNDIEFYIKAGTALLEKKLGRALIERTITLYFDNCFPGVIYLRKPPVTAVASVKYINTDGAETTLASFQEDLNARRPILMPAYNTDWPDTKEILNAVYVAYTAGYGSTAAAVPDDIKQALRLMVATWFENREQYAPGVGMSGMTLPRHVGLDAIIAANRMVKL